MTTSAAARLEHLHERLHAKPRAPSAVLARSRPRKMQVRARLTRVASIACEQPLALSCRTAVPQPRAIASNAFKHAIARQRRQCRAEGHRRQTPQRSKAPSVAVTTADLAVLSQRPLAARATQHVCARLSRSPWTAAQADDAPGARPPMHTRAHAHEPRPFQT